MLVAGPDHREVRGQFGGVLHPEFAIAAPTVFEAPGFAAPAVCQFHPAATLVRATRGSVAGGLAGGLCLAAALESAARGGAQHPETDGSRDSERRGPANQPSGEHQLRYRNRRQLLLRTFAVGEV